ncbi:MAG: hypothetical protein E6F99_07430 [Actinobacteria bacterium]|nr:MAG: hypothetical protein E6F99_07430 [Actinomycetota bacterium]
MAVAITGSTGTVYRVAQPARVAQTVAPAPVPDTASSDLAPDPQFTAAYPMRQQLQLRPRGACTLAVDLDEPRVNVDTTVADLSLDSCAGHPALTFAAGTAVSVTRNPGATAGECAESIRTGALGGRVRIPVQPRTALCVATSGPAALADGLTPKIALVDVAAVAADGTVVLVVSAWNQPG